MQLLLIAHTKHDSKASAWNAARSVSSCGQTVAEDNIRVCEAAFPGLGAKRRNNQYWE